MADPLTREQYVEYGRQGGLLGGHARARKLTAQQRRDIARKAALARWANRSKKAEAAA
jgi:hypothetical protein